MRGSKKQVVLAGLALVIALGFSGCQSSRASQRKREHASEYAALGGEDKASVDRGQLRVGMTTNAVVLAWGQPTTISTISTPNGPFVFWEYYRKRVVTQDPQVMVPRSPTPVPQSLAIPGASPRTKVFEYLDRSAVFHDEKLVNWEPR